MRKRNATRGFHTSHVGVLTKAAAQKREERQDTEGLESSGFYRTSAKGKVVARNNYPAARDGHFAGIFKNHLWVFGGDRHLMAFNDLYHIDLRDL